MRIAITTSFLMGGDKWKMLFFPCPRVPQNARSRRLVHLNQTVHAQSSTANAATMASLVNGSADFSDRRVGVEVRGSQCPTLLLNGARPCGQGKGWEKLP
jgi:hypothetical protein